MYDNHECILVNQQGAAFLFESLSEAARYAGCHLNSIHLCCVWNRDKKGNNTRHMAKEYYAYFKEDKSWMEVAQHLIRKEEIPDEEVKDDH